MTQLEVARSVGVSPQALVAYEHGDRRISALLLEKIAKLFKLTMDQLLGVTPEPSRKGRLSPKAMRHAQRLQALSKTQQRFVIKIIDVLESQNKAENPRGVLSWRLIRE